MAVDGQVAHRVAERARQIPEDAAVYASASFQWTCDEDCAPSFNVINEE